MSIRYPKLLITGGSGLLGMNWACAMRDEWEVILGTHRHQVELAGVMAMRLEWESDDRLADQVKDLAPDLIVHTAGWTDVDGCEADPARAWQANAELARTVAQIAERLGILLIHISTDHLFAGDREFHVEEEPPAPLNEYARSKCQAEQWVREAHPEALVVRTNFFGWGHEHRESLSDWIIGSLRAGRTISMFEDVFFTPILADRLAMVAHELSARGVGGIVHVAGDERISKFEFARRVAEHFYLPAQRIEQSSLAEIPNPTRRPQDMSLSNDRAREHLGKGLGGIDDFLMALRAQEAQGRHAELLGAGSKQTKRNDTQPTTVAIPYGRHHLDEEDIKAVVEVLDGDSITQGPKVGEFGERLAAYTGARFGWPVSSGTAALHLAVAALGIGPGDEVITTPMTFCATANVVLYQGADVKFVDIDPDTLNIDPNRIEEAITPRTKAIIPVDFRGHPAALPEIRAIANRHGLKVIEDAAHSIGSTYTDNGKAHQCGDGVHADLCAFSFHPVKHITTGEGGAVMTNDPDLYRRVVLLSKHGIDRREEMFNQAKRQGSWVYDMESLGFNYRITDIQSALGMSQLKKLNAFKRRRREIVDYYNERLAGLEELILPHESPAVDSNFHLYTLQVKENPRFDRHDLFAHMRYLNYHPMVHYIPVHLLAYYRERFGHRLGDFPVAEKYYNRAVSIPLYPSLSESQVEQVAADIAGYVASPEAMIG